MRLHWALPVVALAACDAPGMNAAQAQQAARSGARASLSGFVPEFALPPVADCVAAAATQNETDTLIDAGSVGVSLQSRVLAQSILDRTTTRTCIADAGVTLSR